MAQCQGPALKSEALLKMVASGAGFRGGTLFRTKIGEDPPKKKDLRLKISGFLVQIRMGTTKQSEKSKVFTTNRWSYSFTS